MTEPLFRLPFELKPGSRILVVGAGGGSDVVCALPAALALRRAGHEVWLGSLASVVPLAQVEGAERVLPQLYRLGSKCTVPSPKYCPEALLASWWHKQFGEERPVWGFTFEGVRPTADAYRYLVAELGLTTLLVLDAGVDAIFWGNEHDYASPEADAVMLLGAYLVPEVERIFGLTNFGTEGFEYEVRHADALLRMSELVAAGALLGAAALAPDSDEGKAFLDFCDDSWSRIDEIYQSNMVGALRSALRGAFGDTPVSYRTQSAKIWVSALTLMYWFFDLDAVAEAKPYLKEVLDSEKPIQVLQAIDAARARLGVLPRSDIPI